MKFSTLAIFCSVSAHLASIFFGKPFKNCITEFFSLSYCTLLDSEIVLLQELCQVVYVIKHHIYALIQIGNSLCVLFHQPFFFLQKIIFRTVYGILRCIHFSGKIKFLFHKLIVLIQFSLPFLRYEWQHVHIFLPKRDHPRPYLSMAIRFVNHRHLRLVHKELPAIRQISYHLTLLWQSLVVDGVSFDKVLF